MINEQKINILHPCSPQTALHHVTHTYMDALTHKIYPGKEIDSYKKKDLIHQNIASEQGLKMKTQIS